MRALTWLLSFAAELWTRHRHACHHDYDTRCIPPACRLCGLNAPADWNC